MKLMGLICRNLGLGWNRRSAGCRRWFNGRRQMSTNNPSPSPWLMLPPGTDSSYNLYSLADKKIITLSDHVQELGGLTDDAKKLKCRGSSRGWLALLSPHNLDLFLFNPISRRHIKLPPINNLPNFGCRDISKVVLSCSPDEDERNCRAVIIHNCNNLLAFCCPGRSYEWTPFGGQYWWDEERGKNLAMGYEDCAYSSSSSAQNNVLFALTNNNYLETWDLNSISSPRLINKQVKTKHINSLVAASLRLKYFVGQVEHLMVTGDDDLLRVSQYVMDAVDPEEDGSYVPHFDERLENCPHMTIDFTVHKYDPKNGGDFKSCSSLGGLALFVGINNQSVAFPATTNDHPELKPNSIYFTDPYYEGGALEDDDDDDDEPFGGHDIGIFNYQDKTVSPCFFPRDVQSFKKIVPPPMWFFPSRFI